MPLLDRYDLTDFIPPLHNIRVDIEASARPTPVILAPDGGRLDWNWKNGRLTATVPRLHIHGVLVIE
jgi:hypothetical protein